MFKSTHRGRTAMRLAAMAAVIGTAFAVPQMSSTTHQAFASSTWTVGVSNNTINNGWRDEMVCSIRAELHHSGKAVSDVLQSNGDTAQQIAQIRQMISKGDKAIVIDPNSTTLSGVIQQGAAKGIKMVVVDQLLGVSGSNIYQAANNQRAYGRLGMAWLVNQLHGKGNVVLMEGIAGAPANTEREKGQQDVLKYHKGIRVVKKVYTGWDFTKGSQEITAILNSGVKVDGVWTSGIDYVVVNAFRNAHRKLVPIVGADNNEFVKQLVTMRKQGLVGAAVTNPPPIGGVGASIALKALGGGNPPATTLLKPAVWSNQTAAGLKQLRRHQLPSQGPSYGAAWDVPGYTNYTKQELLACNSSW